MIIECKVYFTSKVWINRLSVPITPRARQYLHDDHRDERDDEPRIDGVCVALDDNSEGEYAGTRKERIPSCQRTVLIIALIDGILSEDKTREYPEERERHREHHAYHHVRHPEMERVQEKDGKRYQEDGHRRLEQIICHMRL